MNDTQFAIYMYGSYARGEENSSSDVDLIAFSTSVWTDQEKQGVIKNLRQKFPQWENKYLDMVYVTGTDFRSLIPPEMAALAWLAKNPAQPILGSGLLPKAYVPSWTQYRLAQELIVRNWLEKTHNFSSFLIFDQCLKSGTTKSLYSLLFSVELLRELSKKPDQWLFNVDECDSALLIEARHWLHDQWQGKTPRSPGELIQLRKMCAAISLQASSLEILPQILAAYKKVI